MDNIIGPSQDLSDKEQRILNAAVQIFSEKGFSASTTNEIAKAAGVAEGTIFRYFKTKKDILHSLLIHILKAISTKVVMEPLEKIISDAENKDIKQVLKEIIIDRFTLVDKVFPIARVVVIEAMYHEDIREAIYENVILKARGLFKEFFEKMIAAGKIKNIDPDVILRTCLGTIAVFIIQKKIFSDKFKTDKTFDEEIDILADILFDGILVK